MDGWMDGKERAALGPPDATAVDVTVIVEKFLRCFSSILLLRRVIY